MQFKRGSTLYEKTSFPAVLFPHFDRSTDNALTIKSDWSQPDRIEYELHRRAELRLAVASDKRWDNNGHSRRHLECDPACRNSKRRWF
jgi:hypothetical protein